MMQTTHSSLAGRPLRERVVPRLRPQQMLGVVIWAAFLVLLVVSSTG